MASWRIRIVPSSGNSSRSRPAICCGLHALAAGSRPSPSAEDPVAHGAAPRHRRPCNRSPARRSHGAGQSILHFMRAAPRWPLASPTSADAWPAPRAIAPSLPDTRAHRIVSPRYAAAPARSSTALAQAAGRSPEPHAAAHDTPRSPCPPHRRLPPATTGVFWPPETSRASAIRSIQ